LSSHFGFQSTPPHELGRRNAEQFKKELIMDNMGICRFHRNWAEEMVPEIIDSLYGDSSTCMRSYDLHSDWKQGMTEMVTPSFLLAVSVYHVPDISTSPYLPVRQGN
jgi:hypothetical protein